MLVIYTDGACAGNPGPMGIGVAIYKNGKLVRKASEFLGIGTNNVAEYTAVLRALEIAAGMGEEEVEIRSDSELLIKQLNGEYRIKKQHLKRLKSKIEEMGKQIRARFVWVPRELNALADELSKSAISR